MFVEVVVLTVKAVWHKRSGRRKMTRGAKRTSCGWNSTSTGRFSAPKALVSGVSVTAKVDMFW
jgi:hypothetical protein